MKLQRYISFILMSSLACSLWGCSEGKPESQATPAPEPSMSVPDGVVEVSRMKGHADNDSVKPAESQEIKKEDKDSSSNSDNVKTDVSKSDIEDVKGSDMSNKTKGTSDVQTLETTAITARGDNPWSLEAQKVQYDESNQRVRVSAIVWTLMDKENKPRLTVRGKAADVNIESQNVAFDGPVEAEGSEGETMKVNRLVWDSAKQKILGSHGVRVVRKGTVMTGDNLVSSPDLKQVEVSGNVHVTFVTADTDK